MMDDHDPFDVIIPLLADRDHDHRAEVGFAGEQPESALPIAARPNEIDLSHDALANNLGAAGWDRDAKHVATWGKWLFWNGVRWETDERLEHLTRIRRFLRDRADELVTWAEKKAAAMIEADPNAQSAAFKLEVWAKGEARQLRSKGSVTAIESLARANGASAAAPQDFDCNRMIIGTPAGVVELRSGNMRPARREDLLTKLTAVAPESGTPHRWLEFLNEVFDGDKEAVAFMQRAAGYALTGCTNEHKLLFLYGCGRNGKSVFLNALTHIWGDYSRRAPAEVFLSSHQEKHATGLAGLAGARLVVGSELPAGKVWDEAVIKDLTGGDRMTARLMRQDFFDFDPELTLMIAGNNRPSFREVDEAIRARVVLVPFLVTIPPERRDTALPAKLEAEAGRILSWAIEGALSWQRIGLAVPASIAAASADYFSDEDFIGRFWEDETTVVVGAFTSGPDMFVRFNQWADRQGLAHWSAGPLSKALEKRNIVRGKGTAGVRGFRGVRLNGF